MQSIKGVRDYHVIYVRFYVKMDTLGMVVMIRLQEVFSLSLNSFERLGSNKNNCFTFIFNVTFTTDS